MITTYKQSKSNLLWLRTALTLSIGVALMIASAKIQIPFWPVPMTLQVMAVFVLGFVTGARMALSTMLLYMALGVFGLPVFANTPEHGIGLIYLAGPTTGYLFGFIVAASVAGLLQQCHFTLKCFGSALALMMIYGCGLLWLWRFVPASSLFDIGVLPFILSDLLKLALALSLDYGLGFLRHHQDKNRHAA